MNLVIISGRSGSGKSTVLHILEDRGYYCIDNLPASLLPSLAERLANETSDIPQVAVSIDARNISSDLQRVPDIIQELSKSLTVQVIFLDANGQTLLKRFSESRRKHPLTTPEIGLKEAIDKESELLEPLSLLAALTIDTSNMSLQALRDKVKERLFDSDNPSMAVLFQSFGFKNGVPVDADLVYDVRCLPNPYWDTNLRSLTGLDPAVSTYLENESQVQEMISDIKQYLNRWLPRYEENNRSYITVAIGCTGGQHRSVYVCEKLATEFADSVPNVQVRHRELSS